MSQILHPNIHSQLISLATFPFKSISSWKRTLLTSHLMGMIRSLHFNQNSSILNHQDRRRHPDYPAQTPTPKTSQLNPKPWLPPAPPTPLTNPPPTTPTANIPRLFESPNTPSVAVKPTKKAPNAFNITS